MWANGIFSSFCLHQIPGHDQVFINDPRLSDFKQILQKNGLQVGRIDIISICIQ